MFLTWTFIEPVKNVSPSSPVLLVEPESTLRRCSLCVFNESQSVHVTVAAIVKVARTEIMAAAPPQK
jgi:hypothetical protein